MKALWDTVDGKKTYLAILGYAIMQVAAFLQGDMTLQELVDQLLIATGFAGFRHGVQKVEPKT